MADPTTNLPSQDLNRLAEQVARILGLQRFDDLSAGDIARAGCSSTKSTGCSSVSRGCSIETLAGTPTKG